MNKTYTIKLNTATQTIQTIELKAGQTQAAVVEITDQVNVELVDKKTGRAPQKIAVRRVAQDLHIVFDEGSPEEPDLILQGFYDKRDNHLVGIAEDGGLFEYVPTSGDDDRYVPLLLDGAGSSVQALGGTVLASEGWLPMLAPLASAAAFSPWLLGAIGLGAAAGIAAIAGGGDDASGAPVGVPAAPTQRPNGYLDNVGSIQAVNSTARVTDDSTPGLQIGALPTGATGAVLYVDGVITPSTYNPATGTLTPLNALPDGAHTLGYGLTNAGGVTPSSPTIQVTIDTVPPAVPVLHVADLDGDGKPNITGTGEPGGKVTITDPTGATHTTTVDANGKFELEIDMPSRPIGEWRATVTDESGNVSPPGSVSVTDLTAPAAPTVDGVHDNVGDTLGLVPDHGSTDDATPTITGTAEAGSRITLLDGKHQPIGTTLVDGSGHWSFTPSTALPDGTYTITVTATDASNNTGLPSTPVVFTVDTVAPAPVSIYSLIDDVGLITGLIVNGTITDDTRPTMTGRAEPASILTIRDGATVLGTTTADATGYWTFTPTTPLTEGAHAWTVTVSDRAHNNSPATVPINFVVDTTPPSTPTVITSVVDDQGSGTGALISGVATITDDAEPTISGTAEANTTVIIKDGAVQIGTAAVDATGRWTFTPTTPLLNGVHHISAAAYDAAYNVGPASAVFDFRLIAGGVPSAPAITNVIDDVGTVANISPNGQTNDPTPTVQGTAHAGYTVSLYSETGVLLGTALADANGQWAITTPALTDGAHSFTATATDPARNVSDPTAPYRIVVDTLAPGIATAQVLTDNVGTRTGAIVSGDTTDDATPTFSGKAEPGATVTVKDGIALLGTALVDANGNWSFTPTTPLVDGPHSFTTTVTDPALNVSPASSPINFTVDTSGVVVAINSVFDDVGPSTGFLVAGATTNDLRPTINGSATPGGVVKLYVDGVAIAGATATADSTGRWSITPATDLAQGTHLLSATVTTAAAAESARTGPFTLTIDSLAPAAPLITSVTDDVGPRTGNLATGAATDDTTPTLRGTAEPGSKITILDGGQPIGTTMADGLGNWTFTPASPLNDGTHAITVTATDAAGNVSLPSAPWSVVVDTIAPTAVPVIISVVDDQGSSTGDLISGVATITDDAQPTISGTSEPNGSVIIKDGTVVLGTAAVDGTGHWSFTPTTPLLNGVHHISAAACDAAYNVGPASAVFDFRLIAGGVASAPAITNVIDDVGTVVNISPNGLTNDSTPTVKGTATAGSIVTLNNEIGLSLGTATADAQGQWTITVAPPLTDGRHSLTATAVDPAGLVSEPTTPYPITIDTLPPAKAGDLLLIDNVGSNTNPVASGATTDDATPTFTGKAEPGATVTIKDGANVLGTTPVDGTGHWSFTPAAPLADGPHSLTAVVTDTAQNVSPATDPINFTVDTTGVLPENPPAGRLAPITDSVRPDAPRLVSVTDDVGSPRGPVAADEPSDDTTPTLRGTAEPGSKITILDAGQLIGTTMADARGNWTFTPATPLNDGTHPITLTATDSASNVSLPSTPWNVVVDTTPPTTPTVITSVVDDQGSSTGTLINSITTITDDARPTISGTAEANTKVIVKDGNVLLGTAHVDGSGHWSFTPAISLLNGPHHITAAAVDTASNVGAASAVFDFTLIAGGLPNSPAITNVIDDVGGISNISPGGLTDDPTPTVRGTARPGYIVTLYSETSSVLGTARADANGQWSITTPTLTDGGHNLIATATDADGRVSEPTGTYLIFVDTLAPGRATDLLLTDNVGTSTGAITNGTVTDDATPTFTGKAEPGATVSIQDGLILLGTARVDTAGNWSFTPATPLADGVHALRVTVTDPASNVSLPTEPISFTVDTTAVAIAIDSVTDNVGSLTGALAAGASTDDLRPTIHGSATPGGVVKLYVDGVAIPGATTTADGTGHWTITPGSDLAQGLHVLTATVTTAASGESAATGPFTLLIDSIAPARPAILSATDDVGASRSILPEGSSVPIDDSTPTLKGTAEPNSKVTIRDGGQPIGTTMTDALGNWTFTPSSPLNDGTHPLSVTATDAASNESVVSRPWNLTIDTTAPTTPTVIVSAFDNEGTSTGLIVNSVNTVTDDARLTFTGTAQANTTVIIRDGTVQIGTAAVDGNGAWTFTPATGLLVGVHHVTAAAMDAATNIGAPSLPFEFTLVAGGIASEPAITNVIDDVGTVANIPQHGLTNDPTPTVAGTAHPGYTVRLYSETGLLLGTALADANGQWAITTPALTDGAHSFTATATDPARNVSEPTTPYQIVVDTVVPGVATGQALTDNVGTKTGPIVSGDTTDDATPTFSGKAEPGSTVTVKDGLNVLGTTLVDSSGDWSFTPTIRLVDGAHSFTATVTDPALNVSPASSPINFTIDTSGVVVAINSVFDDVGPSTGFLVAGASTNDLRPTINGSATPGGVVKLYLDGVAIAGATATADSTGRWSITPATDLAQGTHLLSATVTTAAAAESARTGPFTLTVDSLAPDAPILVSVVDNVGLHRGNLLSGTPTDDTTPEIFGTAEAGSTVTVLDNGQSIGTTRTDAQGRWGFTPPSPFNEGAHAITLTATDAAANVSTPSAVRTLLIDTIAPNAPIIVSDIDNVGIYTGNLPSGTPSDDTTPTLSGTAEIGSTVTIRDGGRPIGTTTADANGVWTFTPTFLPGNSTHLITVTSTDTAGSESDPASFTIVIDTVAPSTPTISAANDNVGIYTGDIPSDRPSNDATPTLSGTAEVNSLVSIFDGLRLIGTTTASTAGNWTFTTPVLVGEGIHAITVTATDSSGNPSSHSTAWNVLLDTLKPFTPTISASNDNVGIYLGDVASGRPTNDTTPTMSGTAEAESLIRIFDAGVLKGTTLATALGTWSFTPTLSGEGTHAMTVTSTDAAGNVSDASAIWNVVIDTVKPAAPIIVSDIDNVGIHTGNLPSGTPSDDTTPTLSGTAEIGSTVTIRDGGRSIGTTTADANGVWTFTPTFLPGNSTHLITVTSTDTAGNESDPASFTIVIDTVAPSTPTISAANDNVGIYTGDIPSDRPTNDTTPTLSGTAEVNSLVSIFDGLRLIGTTTASAAGNWTFTMPVLVGEGTHAITVTATDSSGNPSSHSTAWNVLLDTIAPTTRTIAASNDNVGIYLGDIASGRATNDATPTMSGTAEAGSLVKLYDNGVLSGSTTADSSGNWAYTPTLTGQGTHAMTITATDTAGNVSEPSGVRNVLLDTAGPVFTNAANTSVNENTASGTQIHDAVATDVSPVTYAITGGADSSRFTINSTTGKVSLNFSPDYEAPVDSGRNNVYDYVVTATDAAGNQTSQNASLTVLNVAETPTVTITQGGGGFWVMGSGQTISAIKNHFVIGRLSSDMAVTYTTDVSFIKVRSDGYIYTEGASTLPGGRDIPGGEWLKEFGSAINYTPRGFHITATSAGGASVTLDVTVAIYNRTSTPFGYTPYVAGYVSPFVPPVALDLDHDGKVSYNSAGVDIGGDGATHTTAWVGPQDGVLVWDKYHDGQVHDSSQYAFAQYLAGAKTDLEGLRAFDTNGNGQLDSGDAIWNEMRVWQDLNGNGLSDAGEIRTLADHHIAAITLTSDGVVSRPSAGVVEAGKSSATLDDGSQMVVADVAFGTRSTPDSSGAVAHPFILDLNHDGKISYDKSLIDLHGTGMKELVAWAGEEDGVLVWDKHHDGLVHDGSQYSFGSRNADKAHTQGLAIFDTNSDGQLDMRDVLWNELGVWQVDAQGVGGIKTLAQLGIESISLSSDGAAKQAAQGVSEAGRTTAMLSNGQTMVVADAAVSHVATDSLHPLSYLDQTHLHAVI